MTARATFRQSDLTRALRAAQDAGLPVVRTEIGPDGRIIMVHEGEAPPKEGNNTCDEVFG